MNELGEIRKSIQKARRASVAMQQAVDNMMELIEQLIPDVDLIKSEAENADNLSEAIQCYVQYDEYGIDNIMREIKAAMEEESHVMP